ncbi:MAG TPA: hypothetical protein PKK48_04225 [Phycisphaerae bacterium]|nr:hypothetical protein [Phycisphaerae bacterium]HPS52915.1 hypothetical protein [Phycisphaerae bacterium]
MEISFTANDVIYVAHYVGARDGKAGRWWQCDELDLWLQPPVNTEANELPTLFAEAILQQEISDGFAAAL